MAELAPHGIFRGYGAVWPYRVLMKKLLFCLPYILAVSFSSQILAQFRLNPAPTRIIGQPSAAQSSLNLVEGREFNSPQGIALDLNATPPILYVADSGNNRVLGFRNATSFTNGQKADFVIGQVDFQSTSQQGPGNGRRNGGLSLPTGLAVDAQSNLYVLDSGNNRVLRFPKPASQTDQLPDLVIGQLGFTSNNSNFNGISAQSLTFINPAGAFAGYLAFDASGNLFVADAGNNRVLRYPAALLGPNAKNAPAADLVLGQLDFATNTPNNDAANLSGLAIPTGIAFDQQGRLYVAESQGGVRSRILIFNPPFVRNGQPASRILGVVPLNVSPQPPSVSEQQFGAATGALFVINNGIGIVDTQNNRLLAFKPADQFTSNNFTQQAQIQYLFGQVDFSSRFPNLGLPEAGPDRLASPAAVAVSPTELFIADSGNNRVIVVPYSGNSIGTATRVLGQDLFNANAPNLVEGREFRFVSAAGASEAGIVADLKSNPPHLYVSDTYNNRILGFRDLRNIKSGSRADIVIGQPDFSRTQINYPSNDVNSPNASGLFQPTGLALDPAGNLYVADSGNGRVLRFANPFAQPGPLPVANLVIGQRSFTSKIQDASASTMAFPYGIAFASNNGLLVSDAALNRVLYFSGSADSFTNGQAASIVFGQPDFNTSSATGGSAADNRFSQPRGIATDTDDRLYVADAGNARVVIFERAPSQTNDPRPSRILTGISGARGVYVNPVSLEVFVAAAGANAVLRYPKFNDQPLNGFASNFSIPDGGPLAVTQDAFGNLYTADASNRVQINYPALSTFNAASYLSVANQALAPGSIATIFALFDKQFGTGTATAGGSPLPTQLAGVQVTLNGIPAPLYFVGPNQINFVVPQGAPVNGNGDLIVSRPDTGQILGNFPIPLNVSSPAIFALNPLTPGAGQAAVINQDGTINGKDHPATNGSVISIFGTGEGVVPNAPPDGVAPITAAPTSSKPQVIVGTKVIDDANVQYSGLAPGLVGVWQVNVKIPEDVVATELTNNITPLVFVINGIASSGPGRLTTIWVTGKK